MKISGSFSTIPNSGQRYEWPVLEIWAGRIEMDKASGIEANLFFGHYAVNLDGGRHVVPETQWGEDSFDLSPRQWSGVAALALACLLRIKMALITRLWGGNCHEEGWSHPEM